MQKTTYYCDGCGFEKRETNHWWGIVEDKYGLEIRTFDMTPPDGDIFCGQECLIKAVAEFMNRRSEVQCPDTVPTISTVAQ